MCGDRPTIKETQSIFSNKDGKGPSSAQPDNGRATVQPDDQKPAIGKVIAPAALWWFRWGAMGTIITGLILAMMNGYIANVLSLGLVDGSTAGHRMLGIGMWFGIIMWFNVWFIIWPNQKVALGIVDGDADEKAAAGRTAMLFSRTNTLLSFPMLFAMVSAQGLYNIS